MEGAKAVLLWQKFVDVLSGLGATFFALDFDAVLSHGLITIVLTFTFVDLFGTAGTLVRVASKTGLLDDEGPRSAHGGRTGHLRRNLCCWHEHDDNLCGEHRWFCRWREDRTDLFYDSYTFVQIASGGTRQISPTLWVLSPLFPLCYLTT